jgi:hypothetical protein
MMMMIMMMMNMLYFINFMPSPSSSLLVTSSIRIISPTSRHNDGCGSPAVPTKDSHCDWGAGTA